MRQGDSLKAQLIRGVAGVGGLKLLSVPLMLAIPVVLARNLGPQGFGQYAFIMSVLTVMALPLNQGMRDLITREVAHYHHEGQWPLLLGLLRRTHQWVLLGAGLLAVIIGAVAVTQTSWLADDRWTLLLIALGILPFIGLNTLILATLRGLGHVVNAQLPDLLVRPIVFLVIVLALLITGLLTPAAALASQAVATVVAFFIGAYTLRRRWPKEAGGIAPEYQSVQWARAWAPFTLLMGATLLNNQLGILLLGWLGTHAQVAALRLAERGGQLVAISLVVIESVIGPQIARAYRDGDRRWLQRLATQSARTMLLTALPVALPLIILGRPIVEFVFGADYVNLAVTPLAVLCFMQLIRVAFGPAGIILMMSGYERDTLVGQVIALILNFIASLVLIPDYGVNGAAWASAIGFLTWNLIFVVKVIQRLGVRPAAF